MIDKRFPKWDIDVENGTVYSLRHKRFVGTNGRYSNVGRLGIHRLIWMVANQTEIPEGYDIHHIDGDKKNNKISNLDLIKHSEHIGSHNTENKGKFKRTDSTKDKISKKLVGNKNSLGVKRTEEEKKRVAKQFAKVVGQYSKEGELVKIWESASEAGRNGFDMSSICSCCRGKYEQHKGFKWKYLDNGTQYE